MLIVPSVVFIFAGTRHLFAMWGIANRLTKRRSWPTSSSIGVGKAFGSTVALRRVVARRVADGEFVALLGPSGCGKTTLLRIIAGLETQTAGRVLIGGRDVTALPPRERGLAMVFQNYAVFPHMTVCENVAFGLRMSGAERARITRQVGERPRLCCTSSRICDRYPATALGRPAPARRGGARARCRARRAADGRAAVQPRRTAAAGDARRAEGRAARMPAPPPSTSRMTRPRRWASPTASRCCMPGGSCRSTAPRRSTATPATRFVGGFVGSPPMNFLPLQVAAGQARLGALALTPPTARRQRGARHPRRGSAHRQTLPKAFHSRCT